MATPHDALFKFTFSNPEHARGQLQAILPAAVVAAVDWSTLRHVPGSFVDADLAQHHADLLFRCRIARCEARLYLLLEHRSTLDPYLPLHLLRYVARVWTEHARTRGGRLPPIVPVVVHHGDRAWTARTDLLHLVDLDGLEPAVATSLARGMPDFAFVLDDLATASDEELRTRQVTALARVTLIGLQRIRGARDLVAELRRWASALRAVLAAGTGTETLAAVLRYIFSVDGRSPHGAADPTELRAVLGQLTGPDAVPTMTSLADHLRQEGFEQGRAQLVRQQLRARFGTLPQYVEARLQAASPAEIDRWAVRVLDAASLADVFAS